MTRILVLETMPPQDWLGPGSSGTGWLRRLLPQCELVPAPAYAGVPLPMPDGFAAVIVPGSLASVTERAPWMLALEQYLRGLVERQVPVLGICFGHQILASALGGRVVPNPRGLELDIAAVHLTVPGRAHPLFAGLDDPVLAVEAHEDTVEELPPGAILLAENGYGVQSFALGSAAGIQFHPEIAPAVLARIARYEAEELRALGRDPEALASTWERIAPPPAEQIVANFVAAATGTQNAVQQA